MVQLGELVADPPQHSVANGTAFIGDDARPQLDDEWIHRRGG
jgi:hypothetical protein